MILGLCLINGIHGWRDIGIHSIEARLENSLHSAPVVQSETPVGKERIDFDRTIYPSFFISLAL